MKVDSIKLHCFSAGLTKFKPCIAITTNNHDDIGVRYTRHVVVKCLVNAIINIYIYIYIYIYTEFCTRAKLAIAS